LGGSSLEIDSNDNVYILDEYCKSVIKYDQDGNRLWQRPGTGDFVDYAGTDCSMALDQNGNVYLSTSHGNAYGSDYIAIRFDAEGNRLWVARSDVSQFDKLKSLAVDKDGNVYLAGSSGQEMNHLGTIISADYTVIKYSQINDNYPPNTPHYP
jgi:DNA-binding beta-propeller fold protein YncE